MKNRVTKLFVKMDWGNGKKTWREAPPYHLKGNPQTALRKLNHKRSAQVWFSGSSIKAY